MKIFLVYSGWNKCKWIDISDDILIDKIYEYTTTRLSSGDGGIAAIHRIFPFIKRHELLCYIHKSLNSLQSRNYIE